MDRKPSDVMVQVLNLSKDVDEAMNRIRNNCPHCGTEGKGDPTVTAAQTIYNWGFIRTSKGLLLLNSEGVGSFYPVTDDDPAKIELYFARGTQRNLNSEVALRLTPADLEARVKESMPLHLFIRTFGSRLDSNYADWVRAVGKIVV